jgi:selenocysteine lyase/cysteine desulfurase
MTPAPPRIEPRLAAWRHDTPGCAERVHLNNAGAALMPRPVLEAIHLHTDLEARIGGYEAADARAAEVANAYTELARIINAQPRNIAITGSATASFIQAASSFDFTPGDVILTTRADYTSYQIHYLALAKRAGVRVVHAGDLPEGGVDAADLRRLVRKERPRLVSVSWMPTHGGLIQDVQAVSDVCEEAGVPLHIDACQAVGQLPIDVARLRCDYLSATARKFLRGPRGVGFLYASDRALGRGDYPLFVDMRGAEWISEGEFRIDPTARRYEDWEFAYALVLGLGAAAAYANGVGITESGARARELATYLRESLRAIDGVRVLDTGAIQSAIVTFDSSRVPAAGIVEALAAEQINAVVSRRWYGLIDFSARGVEAAVRASPHYYNTAEEIDQLVAVVRRSSLRAR